jgi:hypothetical protein
MERKEQSIDFINQIVEELKENKQIESFQYGSEAKEEHTISTWRLRINEYQFVRVMFYTEYDNIDVKAFKINVPIDCWAKTSSINLYDGPVGSKKFITELFEIAAKESAEC